MSWDGLVGTAADTERRHLKMERVDTRAKLLMVEALNNPRTFAQVPVDSVLPKYTLLVRIALFDGESPVPLNVIALQDSLIVDGGDDSIQAASETPGFASIARCLRRADLVALLVMKRYVVFRDVLAGIIRSYKRGSHN